MERRTVKGKCVYIAAATFQVNVRRISTLGVRAIQYWNQLSREVLAWPSLWLLK